MMAASIPASRKALAKVNSESRQQASFERSTFNLNGLAGGILPVVDPCPFCAVEPARIWIETEHAIAFGDAYPVADGHTLVVPRKHVCTIYELSIAEQQALWELVSEVRSRLLTGLNPDGFNIGFNDGLEAGQTVEHAHIHVIPRRKGDVPDPRGGIRWVIAENAAYWKK